MTLLVASALLLVVAALIFQGIMKQQRAFDDECFRFWEEERRHREEMQAERKKIHITKVGGYAHIGWVDKGSAGYAGLDERDE